VEGLRPRLLALVVTLVYIVLTIFVVFFQKGKN
jgi:hypothetical protein